MFEGLRPAAQKVLRIRWKDPEDCKASQEFLDRNSNISDAFDPGEETLLEFACKEWRRT